MLPEVSPTIPPVVIPAKPREPGAPHLKEMWVKSPINQSLLYQGRALTLVEGYGLQPVHPASLVDLELQPLRNSHKMKRISS